MFNVVKGVIDPLKRFLHLKMLNYAPKWLKLMPEIPNVRFSCANSNIRDLLQILATEIHTELQQLAATECPQIKLKKYRV
jgi:hypothetical protein